MKNKKLILYLLALVLCISLLPMGAFAEEAVMETAKADHRENRPAAGTTVAQPFPKDTAGSASFRIPGLVTLSDGTLLAYADARWNTTYDGGGLDTIRSISTDNGANWSYDFVNYLGDNGNVYGADSSCFIDPSAAVKVIDGTETIFMICDLYPHGVALNGNKKTAPMKAKGVDGSKLLLTDEDNAKESIKDDGSRAFNEKEYNYYIDLSADEYVIKSLADDTPVNGYTIDKHFNITGNDGTNTNLFFSDSPYMVQRTSYIYLVKSTDGGKTWSDPELLPVKNDTEMAYLVAPSRGLVTSDGVIVFPCYSYNGSQSSQKESFIYSADDGKTWNRTEDMPIGDVTWCSESVAVEIADGVLRLFFRTGTKCLTYADYTYSAGNIGGGQWSEPVRLESVATNSNCQISAIRYSGTIDGKTVILVSCPTGPDEAGSDNNAGGADGFRKNGKIFVLTADDKDAHTMTKIAAIDVSGTEMDDDEFMYSSLTELSDGRVGLLYEDLQIGWGAGENTYYSMTFKAFELDEIGFDADEEPIEEEPEEEPDDTQAPTENEPSEKTPNTDGATESDGSSASSAVIWIVIAAVVVLCICCAVVLIIKSKRK